MVAIVFTYLANSLYSHPSGDGFPLSESKGIPFGSQ